MSPNLVLEWRLRFIELVESAQLVLVVPVDIIAAPDDISEIALSFAIKESVEVFLPGYLFFLDAMIFVNHLLLLLHLFLEDVNLLLHLY